jgi:hypothetical protein
MLTIGSLGVNTDMWADPTRCYASDLSDFNAAEVLDWIWSGLFINMYFPSISDHFHEFFFFDIL